MKVVDIAELKKRLTEFLALVETGEEVEIRRRDAPIARIVPLPQQPRNRTKLGCGVGTAKILGDLTEPLIPEEDWEMLKE